MSESAAIVRGYIGDQSGRGRLTVNLHLPNESRL